MSDLPVDAESSPLTKVTLRNHLLTLRRQLTPEAHLTATRQLQDQIRTLVRRTAPATIAAYAPVGAEPGGATLPDLLAGEGRLLLPVLQPDNDLDWAIHTGTLETGPRGLREPVGPRLGADAVRTADLVLVPALAVDRHGVRLGRGGGSYDRVLERSRLESALIVALLHDWEMVDEVPAEPHDRAVHGVIRPSGGVTLFPVD
jgi:5-formyltetrahydrofolate cyclo-ligase